MQKNSAVQSFVKCPCCGSAMKGKRPVLDLNTNTISFRGTAHLTPMQAEIASLFCDQFNRYIDTSTLISRVYGYGVEPERSAAVMSVQICKMNPTLAKIGLRIKPQMGPGGGRCMVAL